MSYQDKIKARKRQEFRDKQQRNRIVAELNRQKQGGNSLPQPTSATNQVVVADGDTLSSIAGANGTTEADLLAANPELKQLRTGMVIKAPTPITPTTPGWQGSAFASGGIGLPSNAALGGTTTNPQGSNYFQSEKLTTPQNAFGTLTPANNWSAIKAPKTPQLAIPKQRPFGTNPNGGVGANPYGPTPPPGYQAPQNPQPPTAPRPSSGLPSTYPGGWRRWVGEEMEQIKSPTYIPNAVVLSYLQKLGLIEPSKSQASGGFSSYGRRRGGGGRGRGGGGGGGYGGGQGPRRPAFSTGSQFNGLINWRI